MIMATTGIEYFKISKSFSAMKSNLVRRSAACVTLVFVLMGISTTAHSAEEEEAEKTNRGIENTIVIVRKRPENIQDTPIAITALSADQLAERSLTNLMEVGAFVPNVSMNSAPSSSGGGNNSQIYIRGIGQQDFLFTTDPGVGLYVDGVFYPRTLGGVMDLLDLEQVEVLRGPQGTLFGKNTIGGAISLTSKKPKGDNAGYLELTLGDFNRRDLRGTFDFAINDNLAAKIAISSKNRDGIGKRLEFGTDRVLDETGDESSISTRLSLQWKASDNVVVDFNADYTKEREKGIPTSLIFVDDAGDFGGLGGLWNFLVGGPSGQIMSSDFIIGNRYDSYATGANQNDLDSFGGSMDIDWTIDENLSFRSITAYREMEAFFSQDADASPLSFQETAQNQDQTQFSQEVQLIGSSLEEKLEWVVGAFYFDEFGRDRNDVRLVSGLYDALEAFPFPLDGSPITAPTAPGGPGNPINVLLDIDFDIFNEIDITSYAIFSQGSYKITDKLNLTAGIRYSFEEKSYFLNHTRVNSGVPIIENTTVVEDWSSFTPMASIDYKVNEDALVYASVTQGFKSGGFNGRPTTVGAVDSFEPEEVVSYELGFKTSWADNTIRINGATFFADYTDLQLNSISADDTGNLVLRIQNAGKAEISGFELEIQARPVDNMDIIGSVGYTDFEITELDAGVSDFTIDTEAVKTPKWNASLGVQYTWELDAGNLLSFRADGSYQGKTYQDIQNTEIIASAAHSIFNARLVYDNFDSNWQVALFVTNLTDKRYITNGFQTLTSFGLANVIYGRPRELGLSFKKSF